MAAEAASLKMRNLKDIHEDDGADGEQAGADAQPLDALAMQRVLASMGADKFEPRVVSQLQEFVHRASAGSVAVAGWEGRGPWLIVRVTYCPLVTQAT